MCELVCVRIKSIAAASIQIKFMPIEPSMPSAWQFVWRLPWTNTRCGCQFRSFILLLLLLFDGKPTPSTPSHTHYTCVPCRFIELSYMASWPSAGKQCELLKLHIDFDTLGTRMSSHMDSRTCQWTTKASCQINFVGIKYKTERNYPKWDAIIVHISMLVAKASINARVRVRVELWARRAWAEYFRSEY